MPPRAATPSYNDADAFEIGTETVTHLADWNATNAVADAQSIKVLKPGVLLFYQLVDVNVTQSGSMGAHRTELWLKRGATLTKLDTDHHTSITGVGTKRTYRWLGRALVLPGDVIIPLMVCLLYTSPSPRDS